MAQTAGSLYRRSLKDHWLVYSLGVLTLLMTSTAETMVPKFVQWSLDLIGGGGHELPRLFARSDRVASLKLIALGMVGLLVVGLLGRVGWRQLLARRTHMAGRELKTRLWGVLRHLPLRTFHDYPLGDLMNRATGDWNASRAIHGFSLVMALDMIFFTVLSISAMLTISGELTLYCLAIFPLLPRIILRLAKREHDLHLEAQERLSDLASAVSQALGTIRLQRATHTDRLWQETLAREARDYADRRYEVVKTGWTIFPLGALPTLIAYGILLFVGVRRIGSGELSVGQFVALMSYVLMLQGPLFDMGDIIAEWQRGFASLKRMVEIFNLQELADRLLAKRLEPTPADHQPLLELRDLSFSYGGAGGGRQVLRHVDLAVPRGGTVGISGPIGAGKSTLLGLVAGLLEPPPGQAFVAGGDVAGMRRAWLTKHVTLVPQRAFLFAGTIRANLELDTAFAEDELWAALAMVRLDADVRAFPNGLMTRVGEWGVNLSGGQKQRLALARALIRPRPVILLDDCLSAVDAVTEEEILVRLRARLADATVVWVAHRLSTLKLCDRVYRLEQGELSLVRGAAPAPAPAPLPETLGVAALPRLGGLADATRSQRRGGGEGAEEAPLGVCKLREGAP